jgi:hypothetical protein
MTAKTWDELRSMLHEAEIKEIVEFLWDQHEDDDDDWVHIFLDCFLPYLII